MLALCGGCKQSTSEAPAAHAPQGPGESIFHLHFVGLKQIAADTNNAASFLGLWNLPQTARLKDQTLDKLAKYLETQFSGSEPSTLNPQPSTNLLRPLLTDLVQEEWYADAFQNAGQPGELALAVHLDEERAGVWETNLSTVIDALKARRKEEAARNTNHVQAQIPLFFARVNGWTVFGRSTNPTPLLNTVFARMQQERSQPTPPGSSPWLEGNFDPNHVSDALVLGPQASQAKPGLAAKTAEASHYPKVSLTLVGQGDHLRTMGQLEFEKPLQLDLEPWNIPTNLMSEPLVAFTAVRGIKPWLSSLKAWNDLQIGQPPNQFYAWALQGSGTDTHFASPQPDASNQVSRIVDLVLAKGGLQMRTNESAKFVRAETYHGLEWQGSPFLSPFLESVVGNGRSQVYAGLFRTPCVPSPLPRELLRQLVDKSDIVAYDWELTSPRLEQWLYIGQFLRFVCGKAQLPGGAPGFTWLKAIGPKLGGSITAVNRPDPTHISFSRVSGIGLTSLELHLLVDWLESPEFPSGLHTISAPPTPH